MMSARDTQTFPCSSPTSSSRCFGPFANTEAGVRHLLPLSSPRVLGAATLSATTNYLLRERMSQAASKSRTLEMSALWTPCNTANGSPAIAGRFRGRAAATAPDQGREISRSSAAPAGRQGCKTAGKTLSVAQRRLARHLFRRCRFFPV